MVKDSDHIELTELQRAFVAAFVASGGKNATDAAREAGYSAESARTEAWRLLRKPHVQAAIRAERTRAIGTEGGTLAWSVINGILGDERAPHGVRFEAAKFVLGVAGHVAPRAADAQGDDRDAVEDMSLEELNEFIRRGEEKIRLRKAATESAESVDADAADARSIAAAA